MRPPECYNESARTKLATEYNNLKQWDEHAIFKKLIGRVRKELNINGVSISVLTGTKLMVKYESLLNTKEISRMVSIDGHTILSRDYFLLLDTTKDWRTVNNPFVDGIPYIKFYCGVPIYGMRDELIGVLAIFDTMAKKEFPDEQIIRLKDLSSEITLILSTPIDELRVKYQVESQSIKKAYDEKNAELNDLKLKLGRATSRGSLLTVFEKDGSGGPYSQDHNFKFLTKLTDETEREELFNNQNLARKLMKMGSIKKAASLLCKILSVNYNIDFVYILEIRVAENFKIDSRFFPKENKIESDGFKHADKLIKIASTENEFMSRIIGSHGSTHSSLNFENSIHHKSFGTEFGIKYSNPKENSIYNKGILMPFYRHNSKLVRQNKFKPNQQDEEYVKVFLRSGGYIVGLFQKNLKSEFSDEQISNIFGNVSILRKLYITG